MQLALSEPEPSRRLTCKQFGFYIGAPDLPEMTVRGWIRQDCIKAEKVLMDGVGYHWLIDISEAERFKQEHRIERKPGNQRWSIAHLHKTTYRSHKKPPKQEPTSLTLEAIRLIVREEILKALA